MYGYIFWLVFIGSNLGIILLVGFFKGWCKMRFRFVYLRKGIFIY